MLAQVGQNSVISSVNLLSLLGTSEHNFATGKDKQDEFWNLHAEDQAWKQLRLITTHLCFFLLDIVVQSFELNLESHIMRGYNVLNEKVGHVDSWIACLFDVLCVPLCCLVAVFLTLCPCADHLT